MPGLSLPAATARLYDCRVLRRALFWGSLGALAWTHVGYPVTAAVLARARARPARKGELEPTVTIVVAAHDEERVIERRLENLLALDYTPEKAEIVVVSDGSTDRTVEIVESVAASEPRVRLLTVARGGKTAAQNAAVRATGGEVLAFSDANTNWRPDALRKLVRNFADPEVAYVAGAHYYERPEGTNREGVYTAFENWLRHTESRFGSITAGVGPIYAVRRDDYIELEDLRIGHDLALPYLLVQRGLRAIVDPEARSSEKPARDIADEYGRKLRMFEHAWLILLRGRMLRGLDRLYLVQVMSHRHLRYASGLLHLALLGTSFALVRSGRVYRAALAAQAALLAAALARSGIARYYVAVTWATVPALVTCLRGKVSPVWEKAEGTR
jgi:cellulose synthase/poly-beta-1,6-N-acetylglucosamine synthase-like glycosyltransferase